MFSRIVPPNSVASCGTRPTWLRRLCTRTSRMSIPSIRIAPSVTSQSRGIRLHSVVLPDPEGPTSATISPGAMSRSNPRRTGPTARYPNDTLSRLILPATGGSGRAGTGSRIVASVSRSSKTRWTAPEPSRTWPYWPAMLARFAAMETPYRRKLVRVPIASVPSITWRPVYQSRTAIATNPTKVMTAPKSARQSASRVARATTRSRSVVYRRVSQSSRTKLLTIRMPESASSAVVVARASSSWTWVLTRWSGRPNAKAMPIRAGASTRTTSRSVGLSTNRMTIDPTSPTEAASRFVIVWVSIVRTCVTSLERRETSSPTRAWTWKSSESVTSRAKSSDRIRATIRSPTTPRIRLEEAPDGLHREEDDEEQDDPVEPGHLATGHDDRRDLGDQEREEQPEARRQDEPHEGQGEAPDVRPEIPREAAPRDAAQAANLADDVSGARRDARSLVAHGALRRRPAAPRGPTLPSARRPPRALPRGRAPRARERGPRAGRTRAPPCRAPGRAPGARPRHTGRRRRCPPRATRAGPRPRREARRGRTR